MTSAFPVTHQDSRVMHKEFHAAPDAQSIFEASTPAQSSGASVHTFARISNGFP